MLNPLATWAVWGQQELCYVEFSSHGWLCQAALLKMCPIGNGLFLANPRRMWEGSVQGPLFLSLDGGSPAVTFSMCDLECDLAFLWALAPPEPCCQRTKPASHTGLSCSRTNHVLLIPSQGPPSLG